MWWRAHGWRFREVREHFEGRHEKGLLVFAELPSPDKRWPASYWLAMRSILPAEIGQLADLSCLPVAGGITVLTWSPIWYCPWCGVTMVRHYGHQLELLL